MDVEQAIAEVKSKARGRTRYEGKKPYIDELLVARIAELEHEAAAMREALEIVRDEETITMDALGAIEQALAAEAGKRVADVMKMVGHWWHMHKADNDGHAVSLGDRTSCEDDLFKAYKAYRAALDEKADR